MKAVILAGGFAKRLDSLGERLPKALLEIAGKPIIEYTLEKISRIGEIDRVYISTNKKFEKQFINFLSKNFKRAKLITEPALKEEEKFGAIGGINYLIKKENVNEDLLVIAGDNLFDFEISDFIKFYNEKKSPVVAFFDLKKKEKLKNKFGVGLLDKNKKLISFEEKPPEPKSSLAATCCYIFPKKVLPLFDTYLKHNNPDAPGYFIKWLSEKQDVYGFSFSGHWFDIGSIEGYRGADEFYRSLQL